MEKPIVYFKVFIVFISIARHIMVYMVFTTTLKISITFMYNGKINKTIERLKRIYAPHFFQEYTAIIAIIFIVEVREYIMPSILVKIPTLSNLMAK